MCHELSPITGWKLAKENEGIRPWDDASGIDDPYRCMRADTLLERSGDRWVLDAKYKRDFANEGRNDRFQMCAYAVGFRAARATLVYPFRGQQPGAYRQLLRAELGEWDILIDSVALPMAKGPDECKEQLLGLLSDDKNWSSLDLEELPP